MGALLICLLTLAVGMVFLLQRVEKLEEETRSMKLSIDLLKKPDEKPDERNEESPLEEDL